MKFYFDKEAASKAVNFIELFCSHTKGELAGKPLLLEDWQKKIVGDLFGWKNKKTKLICKYCIYFAITIKNIFIF